MLGLVFGIPIGVKLFGIMYTYIVVYTLFQNVVPNSDLFHTTAAINPKR